VRRYLVPNFLKFGVARLIRSNIFGRIAGIHAFSHSVSDKECCVANRNRLFVAVYVLLGFWDSQSPMKGLCGKRLPAVVTADTLKCCHKFRMREL
jgi:hypothetical protein